MRMNQEMEDDEKGKLFVGGLSWETTHDNLQRYFCRFGDVIDCVVMKNNESGRSRGFGFVTFSDPNIVDNVLRSGPHTLDGRTIDPKPCNPRTLQKPKKGGGYPKVFLGGLPSNITETDLRLFFGRYGKVMEVVIMYDQEKKKSRGFGFLSFEEEQSVDRITNEHFINLHGKQVEIKKAEPRDGSHTSNKINNINSNNSGGPGIGINNSGPNVGSIGIGGGSGPTGGTGQNNNDNNNQWINRNTGGGISGSSGIHSQSGGPSSTGGNGTGNSGGNNGPMSMIRGPNGQISGPPLNMQQGAATTAPMGTGPNMMQGYQGWGTPNQQQQQQQQQNYGYGTPNAPGSYQGWGGPPPPTSQGPPPPPPHQWNNYTTQQSQGYQGYVASSPIISPTNIWPSGTSGGTNWNSWNMAQNSGGNGGGADIYSRQQTSSGGSGPPPLGSSGPGGGSGGMPPPSGLSNSGGKNSSDYGGYGNTSGYGNYSNEQQNSYLPRSSYSNDNGGPQQFQAQPSQVSDGENFLLIPGNMKPANLII